MKCNIGKIDRGIRLGVGIGLVAFGSVGVNILLVSVLGLIIMGTGVIKTCPLYTLFGFNTLGKQDSSCESPAHAKEEEHTLG